MRLKTPFYVVLFLIIPLMSIGQECGTLSPANYQTYERTKQERGFDRTNIELHPEICLNVYYHIVRYSNGTGGIAESKLTEMTALLNQEYNPHNLFFNQIGFDYIDNSNLYNINDDNEFYALTQINNQSNAINIYTTNFVDGATGRADIGSQAAVIRGDKVLDPTLPHEVGHCLNLYHTHHGTVYEEGDDFEQCPELIDGSNSDICGDYVEDTPADPGLISIGSNSNVDSSCNYTGGGGYNPDTRNIMSYSRDNCRNSFTDDQEIIMRDAIAGIPVLQNVVSNSCGIISGDNVTCTNPTTLLTLSQAAPPYLWVVIEGSMEIIGSNTGSSVTVAALSNSASEWGSVRVSYGNGGMTDFDVWIGKPLALETGYISGPDVVDTASIVAYHYESGEDEEEIGATTYEWWLPYPYNVVSPIDYFGDNWQLPLNLGKSISHVFTGYGENNGYVQVMAKNKCGLGGAKIMAVEHGDCNGPGCGGSALVPPDPVPNSSNESFSLDFTTYPEGTYYIYIYDMYSNTVYSGVSNNLEKTVETASIPAGTYYLHIHDGNDIYTQQLIITH